MKRERIDFKKFKEDFISQPDGYFPVNSEFAEDYHGESLRVLEMDMICEWRLGDGKILFVEVPFNTKKQFNELVEYLKTATNLLNKAITERIGKLDYASTKPESNRIPYPFNNYELSDETLENIRKQAIGYEMGLIRTALQTKEDHASR